jgi:hypothetical protein
MAEPPVCQSCGARHWFLDPCAMGGAPVAAEASASDDEMARALRFYRAHRTRQAEAARRRRAKAKDEHKG